MTDSVDVLIEKKHPRARMPIYGSDGAACMDFFPVLGDANCPDGRPLTLQLLPGEMRQVSLGFAVKMPPRWCLELHSRSGQGKVRVRLANSTGIIDADYTGELLVLLENCGDAAFELREDKAVCQAKPAPAPKIVLWPVPQLPDTKRAAGGFGSTDKV